LTDPRPVSIAQITSSLDPSFLPPVALLTHRTRALGFKGPGSSDIFLSSVRKLSGIYGDDCDDGSLDHNPNFYDPGALPSRRECAASHNVRLPPPDIARRLFAAQYTYIGTIFAFADPASFDAELADAYRGPPDLADRDACLAYAKVLMILAFGQLYSVNQWIDFKGPPGFEYFRHALQLLPDAHEEGSILCVETLALIGYFMQNMNRRDAAFLYIGMALRMAISLGLHQEVASLPSTTSLPVTSRHLPPHLQRDTSLDSTAREHRRRVWWSIYSLDRILCVKSGNPITIADDDVGVELPSRLPSEAEYCPAVVLRHYTQLSRILGDVTRSIYRRSSSEAPKSGKRLMESVQRIMVSLSRWNAALPDELRFEPARLSISRESVSTFSHYYQCINMTARPLLFHVVQKRLAVIRADPTEKEREWKQGLSQTTVRVIEMCVSAAQDTINMMDIASHRDLVGTFKGPNPTTASSTNSLAAPVNTANHAVFSPATYGYMDGEHIFSATIVLVMVCAAFPTNACNTSAMNVGLDLLRGMAERGNSHMGARYKLLAHLRSVIMPGVGSPASSQDASFSPLFPRTFSPAVASSTLRAPITASLVAAQAAMPAAGLDSASFEIDDDISTMIMPRQDPTASGTVNGQLLAFPIVDSGQLGEHFYDEILGSGTDFMLWEEGFANPTVDAGYDLTQWTQAAQTVLHNDMDL
jgi:proline utilization trans-activator